MYVIGLEVDWRTLAPCFNNAFGVFVHLRSWFLQTVTGWSLISLLGQYTFLAHSKWSYRKTNDPHHGKVSALPISIQLFNCPVNFLTCDILRKTCWDSLWFAHRISFSCLFPASWHFSLPSQVFPRLMLPSPRQLLFISLLICLIGLFYLLLVSGKGHVNWTRKENHFHR